MVSLGGTFIAVFLGRPGVLVTGCGIGWGACLFPPWRHLLWGSGVRGAGILWRDPGGPLGLPLGGRDSRVCHEPRPGRCAGGCCVWRDAQGWFPVCWIDEVCFALLCFVCATFDFCWVGFWFFLYSYLGLWVWPCCFFPGSVDSVGFVEMFQDLLGGPLDFF